VTIDQNNICIVGQLNMSIAKGTLVVAADTIHKRDPPSATTPNSLILPLLTPAAKKEKTLDGDAVESKTKYMEPKQLIITTTNFMKTQPKLELLI